MRRWILGLGAAIVLIGIGAFNLSPVSKIYLRAGTGLTAKQVCSLTWVSGLDADFAKSIYIDPLLGSAGDFITVSVDEENRTVTGAVLGLFWRQHVVYREGLGCTVRQGHDAFDPDLALPPAQDFQPLELDTAHRDAHFDVEALDAALQAAFDEGGWPRNTLGVAVLHQGRLVGEAYAPGASRETRFHGWSMTKSLVATLAGHMAHTGEIDLFAEGQIPALAEYAPDDRSDITMDHLIRMTGGLAIAELNTGWDPNSEMLFTQADMPYFAATRRKLHEPGEHWQYMSGNTILATDALQRQLGDTLEEQTLALRERIFEPLGIYSAIMEADDSGAFQGSSYLYMTAHDWARLAQLYLDRGLAGETRIFDASFPAYVATPTEGSDGYYGAGFWTPLPEAGLPEGAYHMNGFQGQNGYILPEEELVIVRFGATNNGWTRNYDLVRDILAARRS